MFINKNFLNYTIKIKFENISIFIYIFKNFRIFLNKKSYNIKIHK